MIRLLAVVLALIPASTHAQSGPPAPPSVPLRSGESPLTTPGPEGLLKGTLLRPAGMSAKTPVALIIPGSGPTDRDGNNPLGIRAASYRLLADALAAADIATLRIDKRGMFGSRAAIANPNAVRMADYVADTRAWIGRLRQETGAPCIWLIGHSEGGRVALETAQDGIDICGVVLIATAGRTFDVVVIEQLTASGAPPAYLALSEDMFATLKGGGRIAEADVPGPLRPIFHPVLQPFIADLLAKDPAMLAARVAPNMLIVQGDKDVQVGIADAQALKSAQPLAALATLPGVNHVLKDVASDDRAANVATYADPALPLSPAVGDVIAGFINQRR